MDRHPALIFLVINLALILLSPIFTRALIISVHGSNPGSNSLIADPCDPPEGAAKPANVSRITIRGTGNVPSDREEQ